jgi:hypothetical protein
VATITMPSTSMSETDLHFRNESVHQDVLSAIYRGSGSISFATLKLLDKLAENVCAGLLQDVSKDLLSPDDAKELVVCNHQLVVSLVHSAFVSTTDARAMRYNMQCGITFKINVSHPVTGRGSWCSC